MTGDYSGMLVAITGASSGIGAALARELHGRGADLILIARREALLAGLVQEFNGRRSGSARAVVADLTDEGGLMNAASAVRSSPVDILVNNAGFGSFGSFESLDLSRERQMVKLNCDAPLVLTHVVLDGMKGRRRGGIITLSSLAGFQPLPYMATYAATKAFDLFHGLALTEELSRFNLHSLVVCPGPVETEFFGAARVPGQVTGMKRDDVNGVAREIANAFASKRVLLVPGWRGKILSLVTGGLPLRLRLWVVGKALFATVRAARA